MNAMVATDLEEAWAEAVYSNFDLAAVLACETKLAEEAHASDRQFAEVLRANRSRRQKVSAGEEPDADVGTLYRFATDFAETRPLLSSILHSIVGCAAMRMDVNRWLRIVDEAPSHKTLLQVRTDFLARGSELLERAQPTGWIGREARVRTAVSAMNLDVDKGCSAKAMLREANAIVDQFDDYLPAYFFRANHARRYSQDDEKSISRDVVVDLFEQTRARAATLAETSTLPRSTIRFLGPSVESNASVRSGLLLAERQLSLIKHAAETDWMNGKSIEELEHDRFAASRDDR